MTLTEVRTVRCPNIVIAETLRALIRRFHLNADWIIGLVGERGSGKSLGGANIAFRDFMVRGYPCWSNMNIRMNVRLDEATANYFHTESGIVKYEAEHLDKDEFLRIDGRYEGGCFFFDEFNLEYGESRRSGANVNLMTDRAIQQLRKLQSGLIYTVLDEMYVDTRIRDNTDVFIQCQDVAFKSNNIAAKMKQGVAFEWRVFPMSAKFAGDGDKYSVTKQPLVFPVTMGDIWGIIDTYERQAVGKTSYSDKAKKLIPLEVTEDPTVVMERERFGWIDEKIVTFLAPYPDGEEVTIYKSEMQKFLGVDNSHWPETSGALQRRLKNNITEHGKGKRYFKIKVSKKLKPGG